MTKTTTETATDKTISIKGWSHFQHFKDRRPPWIKLYRDLLDDLDWHRLAPEHAKALVMFWLIASEYDGQLPDVARLAFRLRTTESKVIQHLNALKHWLIQDDINAISTRYQDDAPETETEAERDKETEVEGEGAAGARPRKTFEKPTLEAVKEYVAEIQAGIDPQGFIDHYESNGWKVGKNAMKDWKATVRKWKANQGAFGSNGNGAQRNSNQAPQAVTKRNVHLVIEEGAAESWK